MSAAVASNQGVSGPLTQEQLKEVLKPKKKEEPKSLNIVNIDALQLLADRYGEQATFPRVVGSNFDALDEDGNPAKVGKLFVMPELVEWLNAQLENLMQTQFQYTAYNAACSLKEDSRGVINDDRLRVVVPFRGPLVVDRADSGSRG